jgi:hypothetical protein
MKTKKYNKKYNKKYTVKYTVKRSIKKGGTPRAWSRMSRANQSLCIKKYPEDLRNLGNECYKYADKLWVRTKYDMNDVTNESAPISIFNETKPNNYLDVKEGIHNFMLFWDDAVQQYTLVTAYFNAFEFGTKHNIMSLRTIDQTPDTFIISGEIKKRGNSIHFHDTSSQYFRQECNLKRRAPIIYLYDLINQLNIDIDEDGDIEIDDLDKIKAIILHNNKFNTEIKVKLPDIQSLPDLKDLLLSSFPIGKIEESVIYRNYVDLLKTILTDAFQRIFKKMIQVDYVYKFDDTEYNEYDQKNVRAMTNILCPKLPFDTYTTQVGCKAERAKDKYPFNSCAIPEDYRKSSSSPRTKKSRKN